MYDITHPHDGGYRFHRWQDSFTWVTWLIHVGDMTHSHVWHDSFTWAIWLIHMIRITGFNYDRTYSHEWHDSFKCVTWLIHMRDNTVFIWSVRENAGKLASYHHHLVVFPDVYMYVHVYMYICMHIYRCTYMYIYVYDHM